MTDSFYAKPGTDNERSFHICTKQQTIPVSHQALCNAAPLCKSGFTTAIDGSLTGVLYRPKSSVLSFTAMATNKTSN